MLSFIDPAVTKSEAAAYTGAAGIAVSLAETDLMKGQRFIASRFNSRWQIAFSNDAAPDEVRFAIIEAALAETRAPGILNPVSNPTDKVLVGAGKLTWERVSNATGADAYIPRFAVIDGLLVGLIRPENTGLFLRAIGG